MSIDTSKNGISFWQLITNHKIEIPIIQRDYAQGRNDIKTRKIRTGFLKSIIDSLQSEDDSLELDFVYGNIEKEVLQPLDGQQRLTTLFLLHWYLAVKSENLNNNKETFLKFTYETRISSREFSNGLVTNWNDLGQGEILSKKISDSKWFFLSWKKDPTINAMLTMLDAIEENLKSKNIEELSLYWSKLTSLNSPIVFNFKELNNVGLTDDLYIKMNARGKALTGFENFKAQFEKYIKETNSDKIDWETEYRDKPTETFSHKIDTIWTDLFWKHRGSDDIIDDEFVNFIAGIAIINYAHNLEIIENKEEDNRIRLELYNKTKKKQVSDDAVKRERIERRIQILYNSPEEINPDDIPTKKAFNYLIHCLDKYSNETNDEILPINLSLWDYCKREIVDINNLVKIENNLFIEFIKDGETTYKQRALFFAQTQYLLNSLELNQEFFSQWMRVIRNIVQNATIDSGSAFIGAIGLINELAKGATNIYKYLAENKIESGFASNQASEEKLKAALIQSSNNWKSQIFKVEDDLFLKGEIKFILDFSRISNEYNLDTFNTLSNVFLFLFESKDNLLRRTLLTQEDYVIWDGYSTSLEAHRYSLLNSDKEWKDALNKKDEKFTLAVKNLISHSFNLSEERNAILSKIITESEPCNDYRDKIIQNKNLLNNCYNKRICINHSKSWLYILEKTNVVGDNYKKIKL
nr:DUF262 domain-containing protein [uncultured Flavobacterium sp.]